jgi:hypothetical protein
MRGLVRMCVPLALLALIAVAFMVTVRVCAPGDARAGEPIRHADNGPLVTAVIEGHRPVPTGAMPREGSELESGDRPVDRSDARSGDGTQEGTDIGGESGSRGGPDTDGDRRNLQLHHLSVWDSPDDDPYVYVSFMPISMESFFGNVAFRTAVVDGEEVDVADVEPELDEDHVTVELDGKPAAISSLSWYYAGYGDLGGADVKYMPVCLIRVERPELKAGGHSLLLRIEDAGTGAKGEGAKTFTCGTASGKL